MATADVMQVFRLRKLMLVGILAVFILDIQPGGSLLSD